LIIFIKLLFSIYCYRRNRKIISLLVGIASVEVVALTGYLLALLQQGRVLASTVHYDIHHKIAEDFQPLYLLADLEWKIDDL